MKRRPILKTVGLLPLTASLQAAELTPTSKMAEGPFYPDQFPLDTDNDLVWVNDKDKQAVGEITYLSGKVLDKAGKPLPHFEVEIWQVDGHGAYLHSQSGNKEKHDPNFQGFGRCLTNSKGEFFFRTIKPVEYPGRVPHIHVAVNYRGKRLLTSQLLVDGYEGNEKDFLYRRIKSPEARKSVLSEYKSMKNSKGLQWVVEHDLVLGKMPELD